jgi:Icc-related predicted phosphoesterase
MSSRRVVRLGAIGDLHIRGLSDSDGFARLFAAGLDVDLLVVAGDLTENGRIHEAEAAAELLCLAGVPVVSVLGNHDLRNLRRAAFRRVFERAGIEILIGSATSIALRNGVRLGLAGTPGCGGGFWPVEGPDAIHSRTLKRLAVRAHREATALDRALGDVEADLRVVVTHYAPTVTTLGDEPLAKYWMLGNSELGAVIDRRRADLVIHGHAHLGRLKGGTPGGVPVRNVALPVVGGIHVEEIWPRTFDSNANGGFDASALRPQP